MPHQPHIPNALYFESLFDNWKARNFDMYFYFDEIFDKALASLRSRVTSSGIKLTSDDKPTYQAMFIPVGFSIVNIALISALFGCCHLTLGFTESTRAFHRRIIHIVEERIKRYCDSAVIDRIPPISSDDHLHMEQKVADWVNSMKKNHGFSENQMAIDLTGGTKPMSIGAQNAAIRLNIPAFYLSTAYHPESGLPIPGTESLLEMPPKTEAVVDRDLVFVIMPFSREFSPVYDTIRRSVNDVRLQCVRVDEEIFQGGIMERVRENISKAGIIVAELSKHNPNVYYELGIAYATNKKIIMITQDLKEAPFDIKHLRMVKYNVTNLTDLRDQLVKELDSLKQ